MRAAQARRTYRQPILEAIRFACAQNDVPEYANVIVYEFSNRFTKIIITKSMPRIVSLKTKKKKSLISSSGQRF